MQTDLEMLAPPKGFRKAIPVAVKLDVVIRQEGRCKACGERLGVLADTEFDHTPAIQLRTWDEAAQDTVPTANDPDYIEAKHADCHQAKTTGRRGTSKLNAIDGDAQRIAKLRRMEERRQEEFRRKLLASSGEEDPPPERPPKPKRKWPTRPLRSGGWNGTKRKRAEKDSRGSEGRRGNRGLSVRERE